MLERLVELEAELRKILPANYNELSPVNGNVCSSLAVEYLALASGISGKDLHFIKKLTKVLSHVLQSLPVPLLEKLHQFETEAAEAAMAKGDSTMQGHLLSHAATTAITLYKRNNQVIWAIRAYEKSMTAGNLLASLDPIKAGHTFTFAGTYIREAYKQTLNEDYAVKAYHSFIKSAETHTSEQSGYSYSLAGGAADQMFKVTSDAAWARKAFAAHKTAALKLKEANPELAAVCNKMAGQAAEGLFRKSGESYWKTVAMNCLNAYIEYRSMHPKDFFILDAQRRVNSLA